MEVLLVLLVLVVLAVVLVGVPVIVMYNGLVRLRNHVQEGWRQIDVELHRRHDLVPNLVQTVQGYAAHERGLLEEVVRLRNLATAPGAGPADQAAHEDALSAALGRLFALAENYPQLRANENFLALQTELATTEDRIAAARRFYNGNVRALNTKVETVPSNLVAAAFSIRRAEYFEITDHAVRQVPQVSFGQQPPTGA